MQSERFGKTAVGERASALPVQSEWAGQLARITRSGPEGSATLDESTNRPMVILRARR